MRKILVFLLSIILSICFLFFNSCAKTKSINLNADELSSKIEECIKLDSGYYSVSEKYFDYYFKVGGQSIRDSVLEWTVRCANTQSSENEFGIIKATAKSVKEAELACQSYIEKRKAAYLDAKAAYSPEDYEKYFAMGVDTLLTNRMDLAAEYKKKNNI